MPIDYKKLYQSHDMILTNANPESLVEDGTLESVGYLKDYFKERERYKPPVDFSELKNFARFGSAKKYYVDAFDRIYETYPYDGSLKERIQWELSSSFFDMYVFEEVYPRTNGYVILAADGWGTQIAYSDGYGATATASYEYIFAKGGPNTSNRSKDKDIVDSSGDYKSGYANVWEPSKNRECNLKIGGTDGNTVEFWMKKSEFVISDTGREVIFDANTSDFISSSANYGRLTIEMTGWTGSISPFRITYMSGTAGFSDEIVGSSITTSSIADDSWHHYAFALKNSGSNVEVNFYFDGACNQTIVTGSSIGYVSGNINATIGSLITAPSGTYAPTLGWGKLSGSLDEFRFWKDERSSAEVIRYMIEPVGGGTNTDDANTSLGVYYKFNEGIVGNTTYDSVVLDYSGRISNGTFVGYDSASRNVGSAMVSSSLVTKEFKDPILYPFHPDVQSTLNTKKEEGEIHDFANNSSMYHSLPAWIIEEDEDKEYSPLKNLTQIVGSYFDSLAEQINSIPKLKYKSHAGFDHKPAPFNDRLLQSIGFEYFPELFSDATELEYFKSRNDRSLFEEKLYNIKNRIYHNIYDNIVYINKTKGTEKSFRNLIHCFGVGDEIYRINTYGNRVTYTLKDNYKSVAEYKKYVNFGLTGSSEATVFPHSSSTNSNSKAIISGTYGLTDYLGFTMESEVHFPIRHSMADTNTVATTDEGPSRQFRTYLPFTTASLFGMHQVEDDATGNDLTWATTDSANFQVYAVKASDYSQRSKFLLTGTAGSVIGALGLSSNYFDEVFDDTRWTFSVSVKPNSNANLPDGSSGSVHNAGYAVEFYGVEKIADYVKNEFLHTGTISADGGSSFLNYPKAPYIGAHRTNFSGTLLQRADGNISSTRVWYKYLPTGTIQQHNQDVKNYGAEHPYRSSYLYPTALTGTRIPEIDTLVLNWTFDTVTGSDGSGEFIGADYSSGSAQKVSKYGQFGEIVGKQYLPKGFNFPANSTLPINKKYVSSGKKQLPEMINSSDMVNVLTDDDIFFNKGELARPTNYYTSIEKSMYQTISDEMIKMFSTIKDFNNLVGEPVNKYRDDYKDMAKLRQMFYERVGNTPSLDKYVDFYKWIDLTLDVLLGYLVPMSSDISDQYGSNVRTMVENTVLQRNKYRWKYPTLEDKTPTIEGNLLGINELLYNWEFGYAPLNTAQANNCLWWKDRASRSTPPLSSSNAFVNSNKQTILDSIINETNASAPTLGSSGSSGITTYAGSTYVTRRLAKPLRLKVDESPLIKGGVNEFVNKQIDLLTFMQNPRCGSYLENQFLSVDSADVRPFKNCDDDLALNNGKRKQTFDSQLWDPLPTVPPYLNAKGDLYAPFNIYSASLAGGYHDNIANNFKAGIDITNLHQDTYGPLYGRPMQTPFTEKFVGGRSYRHIYSNLRPHNTSPDTVVNRIEGWRIYPGAGTLLVFGAIYNNEMHLDATLPRGSTSRGEITKRPVNIKNIKMFTGSTFPIPGRPDQVLDATNIGNYSHNYELVMTNGRSINNRYLAESDGNLPTTYAPSTYVTGVIDFAIPRRDLTGSTKSIIVNRFSAPGSPATMGEGMLDLAAAEYSVYNALPWRNLNVRTPLNEWYTDHTNQFGYFSDAQTVAAYTLAGVPYIGGSSSVEASNYDGTGSFHKVNRNSKKKLPAIEYHNNKVLYFNGVGPYPYNVNIGGPATWDALIGTAAGSTQTFTLSAWVNPIDLGHVAGGGDPYIFDFGGCIRLSVDATGKVGFRARFSSMSGVWSTAAIINTNEWAHIAVTYDATSVTNDPTIYVNGVTLLVTEDTTPAGTYIGIAVDDCFLGAAAGPLSRAWQGFLDELSIFHGECSASEILEIYNGTTYFDPDDERQGPGDLSKHSIVSRLIAWWGGEGWTSGLTLPAQYGSLDGTLSDTSMVKDNNGALVKKLLGFRSSVFTYDNWFVQHPIPRSDYQYAWITASALTSLNPFLGYEQPDFSNASLASTDITFCSASDFGSYVPPGFGRVWGSSLVHAGFIFTDFAGMNTNIQEPVSSSANTLGYPPGTALDAALLPGSDSYLNIEPDPGFIDLSFIGHQPQVFNSLILHRQGPYGWPSWKQIRGAQNPVMRYNYKNNIQTFTKVTSFVVDNNYIGYNNGIVSQVEPPITSKFNPLKYQYTYKSDQPFSVPPANQPTNMWTSYGNEKAYFTNIPDPKISNLLDLNNSNLVWSRAGQIGETLQAADNTILAYDTLKKYLLWNTPAYISGDANPIDEFHHMQISEGIYPREHYTYLSLVRERPNFINNFWKDLRADRNLKTINSQGYITASQTAFWRTASIWSLDADDLDRGGIISAGNELYSSGSEGELQNSYSIWHGPTDSGLISPIAGATYNRRIPQVKPALPSHRTFYLGQTEWEAGEQSGYNPSYNTYKEYAEDVRSIGKDYGIIPEYRISEHMEYHVVDKASSDGFLADNLGWLTLTGSVISSSADTSLLGPDSFYTVYSYTDFLKYFQPIDSDFSNVAMPTNLTLKCSALMKFLPYDGFYPSERSVQLATLFSQSYAPNAELKGSEANWRTLVTPFFAPGILYNSIKSGLAVDYPIFTGPVADYLKPGSRPHYVAVATIPPTERAPFEALVTPHSWLSNIEKIVDAETHRSSSIDSTGSFGTPANDLYNLAINNFISEVPRFFLGATDGKNDNDYGPMTTFVSKATQEGIGIAEDDATWHPDMPDNFIYFTADETYKMRIVCSHSEIRNLAILQDTATGPGALRYNNSASYEYNPPTIMMYNRAFDRADQAEYLSLTYSWLGHKRGIVPWFSGTHTIPGGISPPTDAQVNSTYIPVYGSSFGPPIYAGGYTLYGPQWTGIATGSFEPYTPPYYNGYSHIEISYTPESSGFKTITDVMSAITASYYRDMITSGAMVATALGAPGVPAGTINPAAQAAMQLSASINWNQVVTEGGKTRWVIQPKWECPILDFTNSPASIMPVNREWSIAKGMWHQYGTIPRAGSGVFLEIQPGDDDDGNLAEKLGFDLNSSKNLGQIPIEGKTISEAIVAVPFYENYKGNRNFFRIDRKTIDWAQSKLLNPEIKDSEYLVKNLSFVEGAVNYKPAPSVVNLVKAMKKYVIPPRFNFLMNKNQEPMAMAIFEFDHHFTQDDLVKMWQGVLPSEKRTDSASGIQCAVSEIDFGMNLLTAEIWKPDPTDLIDIEAIAAAADANRGFDLLNDVPGDKIGPSGIGFPKNIQWMVFKVKQKASWNYHDITATNMGPTPEGLKPPLEYSYNYNWPYDFFSLIELAKINETVTLKPRTEPLNTSTIIDMLNMDSFEALWNIAPIFDSVTETDPDTFNKVPLNFFNFSPDQFVMLQTIGPPPAILGATGQGPGPGPGENNL